MQVARKLPKYVIHAGWLVLFLGCIAISSRGQSTDISSPSPVTTNDVVGTISARDLGDSRLTDHFYAFTGTPGDVLITVRSNNLNGDVDVFTAGSLRPLVKFTLYAESSAPATKGIYLRRRENLILRVEARSPNDDEGRYQIRFGGSFEPIAGPLLAEAQPTEGNLSEPLARAVIKKGRRVSSVGARINEPTPPPEEIAAAPTPEPTPAESPTPTATPDRPAEPEAPARSPRRARGRARAERRRPATEPAKRAETAAANEPEDSDPAGTLEPAAKTATAGRRTGRRGAATRAPETPPEPESGPRLIIELQDGTTAQRFMSTIRRVTVENNQIVVVGKDGKIQRTRLSEVVRMSIEP